MSDGNEKPTVAFWIVVILTVAVLLGLAVAIALFFFWPSAPRPFIYDLGGSDG